MLNHDQAIATAAFYACKAMQLETLLAQQQRTLEELGQRLQLAQKELEEAKQMLQQPKPDVLPQAPGMAPTFITPCLANLPQIDPRQGDDVNPGLTD